ncbi:protein of unknown function DUF180 [Alkaliphilus metalliredigens QYMF]|uniref:Flagellar assembly factor FliW n=1 Tax=Alkaliphilus metalliredigens (strain QYMF) TaxID=293826 RepID=FLIW_ALKMQ|nr:flagellar assembly protein FliW [Alkaliphilus metalliredigens]A6TL87.1 RecName: Full=Flagellar assembly factor FliW [Alkaliphilus metalliredigens QYMF]ABR46955.1 protein of unknown function DUF180 [Alkaliphilus metalliredigens QYMF]
MILQTKHFGEIEINQEEIIRFPDGIPGFDDYTQYIFIENPDKEVPFHWLQAVEDGALAFVITNPFLFKPDYDFEISKNVVEKLSIEDQSDLQVYTIVRVPENIKEMTANLRAPLVINTKNKKGKQLMLDSEVYHTKHYILEEIQKMQEQSNQTSPAAEGGRD